jgi:FlaA1/EpsC-like NDP-sugar epimerase
LGLKKVQWRTAGPIYIFDIAVSTLLSMMFFWLLGRYAFPQIRIPLPMLVDFTMFTFLGFVITRYRERLVTGLASRWVRFRSQASSLGERVLMIGAGQCGQLAIWLIEKSDLSPAFSIVGIVDDDYQKQGFRVSGYPVLGTTREIADLVAKKNIGVIVFAINKVDPINRDRIIETCKSLPVRIIMIPDLLKVLGNYLSRQTAEAHNATVA